MPHLGLDIFQVATSLIRQRREGAAHDLAVNPNAHLVRHRLEPPVHPVVIVERHDTR